MPTPSEVNKIKAAAATAVAALLARESNAEMSADELADEIAETLVDSALEAYEAIQAKSYNLVVVASFRTGDGTVHTTAVGPLSTRAKQRARDLGERFAWDYKTRTGEGKYSLVPLVRDPKEAWDEARAHQVAAVAATVERPALALDPFGPTCICGLPSDLVCPRHPEGRADGR